MPDLTLTIRSGEQHVLPESSVPELLKMLRDAAPERENPATHEAAAIIETAARDGRAAQLSEEQRLGVLWAVEKAWDERGGLPDAIRELRHFLADAGYGDRAAPSLNG